MLLHCCYLLVQMSGMESVVLYHYRQPHEYRHFGLSVEINKIKPFLKKHGGFFAWHLILWFFFS